MKKIRISGLLLALLMILCACAQSETPPNADITPPDTANQPQDAVSDAPPAGTENSTPSAPPSLEELTVELVVEWESADALLSRLGEMSDLLQTALDEVDCTVDRITITISTAGGFTAQSLAQGGVDAALLPAEDYISCEDEAAAAALSTEEELSRTAIAVSKADPDLNDAFRSVLFRALTETDAGQEFLSICCPGAVFAEPSGEALQRVRDYVAGLEEAEGGHA